MFSNSFWSQFDAFAKPLKDFRIKTLSGALVSIFSTILIIFLFISELSSFVTPSTKQDIVVDINRGLKMSIQVDITYMYVPCAMLNLDTMDSTGEQQIDVSQQVYKTPVDLSGNPLPQNDIQVVNAIQRRDPNYCGSCYGAESETRQCCNTCKEVQLAYQERRWIIQNMSMFQQCREEHWDGGLSKLDKEGCRIHGKLYVNRVAGSFHISPGDSYAVNHVHVHSLQGMSGLKMNMSHKITTLSFGNTYPEQINPLDGVVMHITEPFQMFTYYCKLVPTLYMHYNSTSKSVESIDSNQYSVTWHSKGTPLSGKSEGIPGLFFNYEISPLLVKISPEEKSFIHFLTNTCAIVGGVFTVASLLDALIYQSTCVVRKKLSYHNT